MSYIICQSHTWRIYKENGEEPILVGIGGIQVALAVARSNDIIVSEFYNLQSLEVA